MPQYAQICLNLPEWLLVLYFLIVIPCLLEDVLTYFNVYTKLEVLVWRKMTLFCWRHIIWFNSSMYFIWFLLWLNICTSKISNLLLTLGVKEWGLWIFIYLILVYLTCSFWFLLKHNVDDKNMRNIDVRIHLKLELKEIGCWFNISTMEI